MGRIAVSFFCFAWSFLLRAEGLPYGWDVVLNHSQFEFENETFDLYSLRPANVKSMLEAVSGDERRRLLFHLYRDRRNANQILHLVVRFVQTRSVNSGMVEGENVPKLATHLSKILTGKYPFSLVTAYNNPFVIHQLFGVGLDEGEGVPLERRLVGRGMDSLPRPSLEYSPVPVCYALPYGPPICHSGLSQFLSSLPRVHGGIAEIRTLTKSASPPYDFSELLFYRAIAEGWFFWTQMPIPDSLRPAPLSGETLRQAQEWKRAFPELPNELLFPDQQKFVWIDDFYSSTITASRERLYQGKFLMDSFLSPFPDPDFVGKYAHVQHLSSRKLLAQLPQKFASSPVRQPFHSGRVEPNLVPVFACSALLTREQLYEYPRFRARSHPRELILLGEDEWTVPKESYIGQAMQSFRE